MVCAYYNSVVLAQCPMLKGKSKLENVLQEHSAIAIKSSDKIYPSQNVCMDTMEVNL